MKKIIVLLKAIMSEDMNLFKYKVKENSPKVKKMLFPVILAVAVMCGIGVYYANMAEALVEANLTFVMLTMAMVAFITFTLVEGVYKSQPILFESKDNDLLFALPVSKKVIILARIIKMMIFQYIYGLLIILPAFAVYAYYERPGAGFYIVSFIMTFLLPIIPTIISSVLGFIVRGVASKFKARKIVQALATTVVLILVLYASLNLNSIMTGLVSNATNINETITKVYYPIGAYISLIQKFDLGILMKLLVINVIPLVLFIYIGSINYFKIISREKEHAVNYKSNKKIKYNRRNQIVALVKKELRRYFSSTVYMFNSSFGLFLLVVMVIGLCMKADGIVNMIASVDGIDMPVETIKSIIPMAYVQLIVFVGCMTSITSSSISIEGKSFYILKSMPLKVEKILAAKIVSSNVISLPLILISDLIFIIFFKLKIEYSVVILLFSVIMPTFSALLGLLLNLKYPKMNASNDTEVVKQSTSSMVSVLIGMGVSAISVLLMIRLIKYSTIYTIAELVVFSVICLTLWIVLKKYGKKRVAEIN